MNPRIAILLVLLAMMTELRAEEAMSFEEHVVSGLYNAGDALWGVCGGLVLLALVVLVVGLKVAGAIRKK